MTPGQSSARVGKRVKSESKSQSVNPLKIKPAPDKADKNRRPCAETGGESKEALPGKFPSPEACASKGSAQFQADCSKDVVALMSPPQIHFEFARKLSCCPRFSKWSPPTRPCIARKRDPRHQGYKCHRITKTHRGVFSSVATENH